MKGEYCMNKKVLEEIAKEEGYSNVVEFLYDYRIMFPTVRVPKHTKLEFIKLIMNYKKENRK